MTQANFGPHCSKAYHFAAGSNKAIVSRNRGFMFISTTSIERGIQITEQKPTFVTHSSADFTGKTRNSVGTQCVCPVLDCNSA